MSLLLWALADPAHVSGAFPLLWGGTILTFAGLGWTEDVRGMTVKARAVSQLAFSAVTVTSLGVLFGAPWWLMVVVVVGLAAFVNAANFMDGLNGLSGLFGVTAGLSYAGLGAVADLPWLLVGGACVAASFAVFLPWNAVRPRLFLGDVGSYALGAAVGSLSVAAAFAGAPIVAALAPVAVYLVDTACTLVRRVYAGERWFEPHRSHIYQRLNQAGLPHLAVASVVAVATSACGLLGLVWTTSGTSGRVMAGLSMAVVLAGYLSSPHLRLAKKAQATRAPALRLRRR
ncbi:hypothetical protein [Blastococcus sp. SYSU DS1021]